MKNNLLLLVFGLFAGILFLFSTSVYAQNPYIPKEFIQRTSQYSPSTKLYYLKGNFAMIGNTNMRGVDPNNNNNNGKMEFVDVDNVSRTINSSRAVLTFPMDYDANPECSEVVYAGLYWSGRAHNYANGPDTWIVGGTSNNILNNNNADCYRLTIDNRGTNNNNNTTYTFAPRQGYSGESVVFVFHGTASNYTLTVQVGSNPAVPISATVAQTNEGGNTIQTATFSSPYEISTSSCTIYVTQLRKRTNRQGPNNNNYAVVTTGATAMLSKHSVLFKYGDATEDTYPYQTVNASSNEIFYPVAADDDDYIYVAYAEVTDYVKEHGRGNYFVGNIAINEGSGGNTEFTINYGLFNHDDFCQMKISKIILQTK